MVTLGLAGWRSLVVTINSINVCNFQRIKIKVFISKNNELEREVSS